MLIYGRRKYLLGSEKTSIACHQCQNQGSTEIKIYQRYAHFIWIPLFPWGKTASSICHHCQFESEKKDFQGEVLEYYSRVKSKYGTSKWTYTGLVLFCALLAIGLVNYKINQSENDEFIQNPAPGDIYEVKLSDNQFTLYRVEKVKSDTVILKLSSLETNKKSGLFRLKEKGDKAYSIEIMTVNKSTLKDLYQQGHIVDIDRNE